MDTIKNEQFINKVLHGDCLEWMPQIEDKSVDMILCDLPYQVTSASWDTIIPFDLLWNQYKRIIKDGGAIVLTSTQPFTSMLVTSNQKGFKHEWIWDKKRPSGFQVAKYKPMQRHESILVFSKNGGKITYYPIKTAREKEQTSWVGKRSESSPLKHNDGKKRVYKDYYPQSILEISKPNPKEYVHPTQKPVTLFEYLIKTYTLEGETVLDNCLGSGTTAVACINTNRNFIGIEKEWDYCEIANKRIEEAKKLKV